MCSAEQPAVVDDGGSTGVTTVESQTHLPGQITMMGVFTPNNPTVQHELPATHYSSQITWIHRKNNLGLITYFYKYDFIYDNRYSHVKKIIFLQLHFGITFFIFVKIKRGWILQQDKTKMPQNHLKYIVIWQKKSFAIILSVFRPDLYILYLRGSRNCSVDMTAIKKAKDGSTSYNKNDHIRKGRWRLLNRHNTDVFFSLLNT